MDYVNPSEVVSEMVKAGKRKAALGVPDMLIRGILAGAFLGFATSLVFVVLAQGVPAIVGAIVFPVGFVMLVLLGLELATGNFALLPAASAAGEAPVGLVMRNWLWVYSGNLLGSVLYAALFYLSTTNFGTSNGGPVADLIRGAAQKKTLGYAALGIGGWGTAFVKGMLCNWMVTVGAVLALASRSTAGKIAAMWLPILTFFAQGFEHSIVNMFVIPAGMLFGAPVSTGQWWMWNQVPVTLGNIVSGALFTGLALYFTYPVKRTPAPVTESSPSPETEAAFG
jgi:formate/nitrite transporter